MNQEDHGAHHYALPLLFYVRLLFLQVVDMHSYARRTTFHVQPTKKVCCSAKIILRYIHLFNQDQFNGASLNTRQRTKVMDSLRNRLQADSHYHGENRIYVSLPKIGEHTNHKVTCESALSKRMHPSVKKKIVELVSAGISHTPLVKSQLRHFAETEFKNEAIKPLHWDRSYYPTSKDIRNHVDAAIVHGRLADIDQENLRLKIDQWQQEDKERQFFYRSATVLTGDNDVNPNFLFIHQDSFQKKLMKRYGNTLCLLDATYKTTKYSLPLFMLVVRTNVQYCPVAEFIVETESADAISEALSILKAWNRDWNPSFFMVDYCDAEINAIETVFPQVNVYVCAFHREQAWERWSRGGKYFIIKIIECNFDTDHRK